METDFLKSESKKAAEICERNKCEELKRENCEIKI